MKNDIIDLWGIVLVIGIFAGGILIGAFAREGDIEKKCIYENRVEFSGQMFSCQWLPGVETSESQYERKPHPNKEVLK